LTFCPKVTRARSSCSQLLTGHSHDGQFSRPRPLAPRFLFYFLMIRPPRRPTLFPYTTLFRSSRAPARICRGSSGRPGASGSSGTDRKSTRLNSSHEWISYAVFCLKKKKQRETAIIQGTCLLSRHDLLGHLGWNIKISTNNGVH